MRVQQHTHDYKTR